MNKQLIDKAKEEFKENFVDTEGCQASKCEEGCQYCKMWGGKEGEFKMHKRPKSSSEKIIDFLESKLQEAYKAGQRSMLLDGIPTNCINRVSVDSKFEEAFNKGYNQAVAELHSKLNKDE